MDRVQPWLWAIWKPGANQDLPKGRCLLWHAKPIADVWGQPMPYARTHTGPHHDLSSLSPAVFEHSPFGLSDRTPTCDGCPISRLGTRVYMVSGALDGMRFNVWHLDVQVAGGLLPSDMLGLSLSKG